jgi:hypothetical protein
MRTGGTPIYGTSSCLVFSSNVTILRSFICYVSFCDGIVNQLKPATKRYWPGGRWIVGIVLKRKRVSKQQMKVLNGYLDVIWLVLKNIFPYIGNNHPN